jgi:hypothetical protein
VIVSRVWIERISAVDRQPADARVATRSGVVASDGQSIPAPPNGATIRIAARRLLSFVAMGSSLSAWYRGRLAYWLQDDLVGADAEELAESAHLGHLRHSSPALPEIDCLRLDADPQRQFKLGPSLFSAKRPDRLHDFPHSTVINYNRVTSDRQLKQMVYFGEKADAQRFPPPQRRRCQEHHDEEP